MKYVDKLLQETDFLQQLDKLEQLEQNRQFCRHGLAHLLDTARIAWIGYLEQKQGNLEHEVSLQMIEKEDIYLAALLHDLGRVQEYENGKPHHDAGAEIAETYLQAIGYPKDRMTLVLEAIQGHRSMKQSEGNTLTNLLYWADKKSRSCFFCKSQKECKWSQEKRNQTIKY